MSTQTVSSTCVNCNTPYHHDELYCANCGYILPSALHNDAARTRHINHVQDRPVDLQWGTGYFHYRARLFLRLTDGDTIIPVPFRTGSVILGRKSDTFTPDVDLTPFDGSNLGVSRRHIRIDRLKDSLQITDLDSVNGTYLNRDRLEPGVPHPLRNRAVLQLGKLILRVQFV